MFGHERCPPGSAARSSENARSSTRRTCEVLGAEEWRPYTINVDAARGVVTLRGQVDRPDQITALERAVRTIVGVIEVENLLHLPGTPPPNIRAAEEALSEAARRTGGTTVE